MTVEFYRIDASPCTHIGSDMPLSYTTIDAFNSDNFKCGLTCSTQRGPFSPLRRGSANEIYVIPAPDQLSFGEATLLAAACCIPAILSLLHVWIKIYETRSKKSSANEGNEKCYHCSCPRYAPLGRTANRKVGKMGKLSKLVRSCLSHVQMIVLSGAVLTILTLGEKNFFSLQVRYQTEPMASIGKQV